MSDESIGRLERVALRTVWQHEAYDFTRWLQEQIDVLSECVALELGNVSREEAAGAFSIDLVAEDQAGRKVIIENQLEKSNHDHLGKVLTYMVAMEAQAAIWVVSEPRPEHVAVIAWLNDSSSADFYLVKVEAVRIGASPPAPLLTLIVGPSAEAKAVSRSKREFSERHDLRQSWWTKLVARADATLHSHISPGPANWISVSSGVRGLGLNHVVLQNECCVELYIDRGDQTENKAVFDQLADNKAAIEASFGGPLLWQRLDTKRACRIRATLPGGYRSPDEEWDDIQATQAETMSRLNAALQPYLKSLRLGA